LQEFREKKKEEERLKEEEKNGVAKENEQPREI